MSADDDDEFWFNDDFIATIENVVKKAEEASAARHGGTPTPHSSAAVPSHSGNLRPGESGTPFPSAHGTHHVSEFLSSRPSDCSVAPAARDFNSGAISRGLHGDSTIADLRGIPHPSLQEVPVSLQARRGINAVGEDIVGHYGELMAEKDGMISILRSRVQEAERQLDELHNRVGPQNMSHPSIYQQQIELERLSAQLMFKDHEIIEGQRARAEKEELLKDALAETAILKAELEQLKKSRPTGAELKRPRNEADMDLLDNDPYFSEDGIAFPPESLRNRNGPSKPNQDPWSPPWVPEGVPESEGNATTGLRLAPQEEPPNIETLNVRAGGNGSVSLNGGRESTKTDTLQANESHKRGISRRTGTTTTDRSDGEELPAIEQLNGQLSRTSDMYYSLQHLWGLKGVRNDGISLLSKLYASCRQDLYILFSNGESQVVKNPRSSNRGKEGQIEGGTISEKLHTALAKVANGLAHPQIIIKPLLEFCKLENVNLVGSALHVLRCILQHDSSCRQSLLLRRNQQRSDCQVQPCSSCETLDGEKIAEEKGWFIQGFSNGGSNLRVGFSVLFSSPRVKVHPQAGDNFGQHTHGGGVLTENGVDNGGQEPPRGSDHLQRQVSHHGEAGFNSSVSAGDMNLSVKWMLDLALTSLSSNVKFEAVANLGVLVMHSEPLTERSKFGPLLCHGALDLLLKESARAEIQLQAVRIVHLLLHCPAIIERFCAAYDDEEKTMLHSNLVNEGGAGIPPDLEHQADNPPADGHNQGISGVQPLEKLNLAVRSAPQRSSYTELSKVKLLEALTECLKHTGNNPQGYALHRSVIRLLAFIMAFGDAGAATLMRAGAACEDPELGTTCNDHSKEERVLGGESASGQNIAGDGSGLAHLKGPDLGDKENGIPIGMVDESVDDSEKPQNIPQRLLALIDSELDAEEREEWNDPSIAEERDHLIHEAVTLLCSLSSDAVQSPVVLGHLISNKEMARLTLSVTNRLVSRKSHSWAGQKSLAPNELDIAELARGLRGRVLRTLDETSPFSRNS
ncbi:unnamed protein product [Calypogeia fissa]